MLARPKKCFLCVKYNPKGSYVGFNYKILAIKFPAAKMWRDFHQSTGNWHYAKKLSGLFFDFRNTWDFFF